MTATAESTPPKMPYIFENDILSALRVLKEFDGDTEAVIEACIAKDPKAGLLWESEETAPLSDQDVEWMRACLEAAEDYLVFRPPCEASSQETPIELTVNVHLNGEVFKGSASSSTKESETDASSESSTEPRPSPVASTPEVTGNVPVINPAKLYNTNEAAILLSQQVQTLRSWRHRKQGPPYRQYVFNGDCLYLGQDLIDFIQNGLREPDR